MGGSVKIDIHPDVLEEEITYLKSLLKESEAERLTDYQMESLGYASTALNDVITTGFTSLNSGLIQLIQATIDFLTSCKDGYIGADSQ